MRNCVIVLGQLEALNLPDDDLAEDAISVRLHLSLPFKIIVIALNLRRSLEDTGSAKNSVPSMDN
jgi:hypothetical protein